MGETGQALEGRGREQVGEIGMLSRSRAEGWAFSDPSSRVSLRGDPDLALMVGLLGYFILGRIVSIFLFSVCEWV